MSAVPSVWEGGSRLYPSQITAGSQERLRVPGVTISWPTCGLQVLTVKAWSQGLSPACPAPVLTRHPSHRFRSWDLTPAVCGFAIPAQEDAGGPWRSAANGSCSGEKTQTAGEQQLRMSSRISPRDAGLGGARGEMGEPP